MKIQQQQKKKNQDHKAIVPSGGEGLVQKWS